MVSARIPIAADREHQHDILRSFIAMERHIATLAVGDQKFPQSLLTWPANQWMSPKNLDSVANDVNCDVRDGCGQHLCM